MVFLLCFMRYFATVNMPETSSSADLCLLSLGFEAKPSGMGNVKLLHQQDSQNSKISGRFIEVEAKPFSPLRCCVIPALTP